MEEKEDSVELLSTFHTGTTHSGFTVTCDLTYLRSELATLLKNDKRCQDLIEDICRAVWSRVHVPLEVLEELIATSIESNGPTITALPVEAMAAYFCAQLESKFDEVWDSLVREAFTLWPGITMDASGDLKWPALRARTVKDLAKPIVRQMKRRIGVRRPGRTKGTGLFKTAEEFRIALREVFLELSEKPSSTQLIGRLRQHPRCRQKTSSGTPASQARTLRSWLQKAGYTNRHDAWRKHLKARKSGK